MGYAGTSWNLQGKILEKAAKTPEIGPSWAKKLHNGNIFLHHMAFLVHKNTIYSKCSIKCQIFPTTPKNRWKQAVRGRISGPDRPVRGAAALSR